MSMKMTVVVSLCLLALAAFATPAATAVFTARAGFGGASEGTGTLKLLSGRPRQYHVRSFGRTLGDGTFRLDQTVLFEGEPPRQRHWILKAAGAGEYTGTLSDAAGAVSGRTDGSRLTLRYRLKGPLVMQQTLDLMPDGTINNVGRITLLGIPVGHLQETIVRKPTQAPPST